MLRRIAQILRFRSPQLRPKNGWGYRRRRTTRLEPDIDGFRRVLCNERLRSNAVPKVPERFQPGFTVIALTP
jgi:hypothetical protein